MTTLHPRKISEKPWTKLPVHQVMINVTNGLTNSTQPKQLLHAQRQLRATIAVLVARLLTHYAGPQHLRLGIAGQFSD